VKVYLCKSTYIKTEIEFASAAWDPNTAQDTNQLDKVLHHAVSFVKVITTKLHLCLVLSET